MKSILVLSVVFFSGLAYAQEMQRPPSGSPPQIPQSAYAACSGKAQGDAVTDGQMEGTCEQGPDGQLALHPSGAPPGGAAPVESASAVSPADGAN